MSTAKHTPGPWIYEACPSSTIVWSDEKGRSVEICKVTPRGEVTGSEGEANAAFIVTACNAHEELLAACEAAYDCFGYDENWWKAGIMRTLESAIAKAGGGK